MEGIGWDIVTMLLPFLGRSTTLDNAKNVLDIIVAKGNAKEVFLKCNEALKNIIWERNYDDDDEHDDGDEYDGDERDDDGGEASLAEQIEKVRITEKEEKLDPVMQTVELCQAINAGPFLLQI